MIHLQLRPLLNLSFSLKTTTRGHLLQRSKILAHSCLSKLTVTLWILKFWTTKAIDTLKYMWLNVIKDFLWFPCLRQLPGKKFHQLGSLKDEMTYKGLDILDWIFRSLKIHPCWSVCSCKMVSYHSSSRPWKIRLVNTSLLNPIQNGSTLSQNNNSNPISANSSINKMITIFSATF